MRFFGKSVRTDKMYNKLPDPTPTISVAIASLVFILAANVFAGDQQEPASGSVGGASVTSPADGALGRSQTQELLQKSIETIESRHSISAEISHRVDLFGRQLVGKGYYCEERSGPHPLVRFELKTPVGDSMNLLKQVSDGKFLWISRVLMDKPSLVRVDLERLDKIVGKQARAGQGGGAADGVGLGQAISLGGMPGLLRALQADFDFESAQSEILYSTPVWKLSGGWQTSKLLALLPDQKEAIEQGRGEADLTHLPQQIPDHVCLWLGKDDLLPYRIEYRRTESASHAARAIVTMQLLKVSVNVPLDPSNFVFRPAEVAPIDQTSLYINRIVRRAKQMATKNADKRR